VPISELIHKENYEMDHEGRQHVKETPVTPSPAPSATPTDIKKETPTPQTNAA